MKSFAAINEPRVAKAVMATMADRLRVIERSITH